MVHFLLMTLLPAVVFASYDLMPRIKRQYYVCGTYPNQYYSYSPCNNGGGGANPPSTGSCTNGGRLIGVGCYYDFQCTPYSGGALASCLNGCCCTVPISPTPPPANSLGYCPSGQRSQVVCTSNSGCQSGQTCMGGLCCTTIGNEWQLACGGSAALAACTAGSCGQFVCTSSNYCCECRYGQTSGTCTNGCPAGYSCGTSGYCCPTCPSGRTPFGMCYNGQCAAGYTCSAGNICCN